MAKYYMLSIITQPTIEPVTLTELKNHLRLDVVSTTLSESITINGFDYSGPATGTSVDILNSSATIIIQIGKATSSPACQVAVQHSTDNSTWTTFQTFTYTGASANSKSECVYTGDRRYVRASITVLSFGNLVIGAIVVEQALSSVEDGLLTMQLQSAREWCEQYTNRAFISTQYLYVKDNFNSFARKASFEALMIMGGEPIYLPISTVLTIDSVKYIDSAGTLQTLDPSTHYTDIISEPARILRPYAWPVTHWFRPNTVQVTFTAGYGATAASVPARAKQAILLLAGHWYENREGSSGTIQKEIELGVKALLSSVVWEVI